ncbi:GntR family transcriptional regulator [Aeribacillus pallidus]
MKRPMDIAYEYIKERIMNGAFLPSQKLNESELSNQIGVSRNTVKKALFKLEQECLVDMEENKGATVKSFTVKEVVNYFEIRELLESCGCTHPSQELILQMSDTYVNNTSRI